MAIPTRTLFAIRRASAGIDWVDRYTPADLARDLSEDVQRSVLSRFVIYTKARARIRPPRNSGRVPVRTGALRNSLRIVGIGGRTPRLVGLIYGLYVQRWYGAIYEIAWRRFARTVSFRRAVSNASG